MLGLKNAQRLLFTFFIFIIGFVALDASAKDELPTINVAVLSYGTINWELDVIKHHGLDTEEGVNVNIIKVSNKNAAAIALQSGNADVILTDIFWAIKQQPRFLFSPTHKLSGGIYASKTLNTLAELSTLGVAGGANDKNWLVFQAYNQTLANPLNITPNFAAPPLVNALMAQNKIDGSINFWHYNAKLEVKGFKNILSTQSMLTELGVSPTIPLLGWVFSTQLASEQPEALNHFLNASNKAKQILTESPAEWERIRPLLKAENDAEFLSLQSHYKQNLIDSNHQQHVQAIRALFDLVKALPGQTVFKSDDSFSESTVYRRAHAS